MDISSMFNRFPRSRFKYTKYTSSTRNNGSRELAALRFNRNEYTTIYIILVLTRQQSWINFNRFQLKKKKKLPALPSFAGIIKISSYFFNPIFRYFIDKLKWNFASLVLTNKINLRVEKWYANGRRKPIFERYFTREIRLIWKF